MTRYLAKTYLRRSASQPAMAAMTSSMTSPAPLSDDDDGDDDDDDDDAGLCLSGDDDDLSDADAAAAAAAAAAATAPRHGQPQVNLKRQQQTITCHKLGKLANKLGDMEHIKSTGSSFCRMLPR